MKKFTFRLLICLFLFLICPLFSSCEKQSPLLSSVTETRTDIYTANSTTHTLKSYLEKRDGKEKLTFFADFSVTNEIAVFIEMEIDNDKVRKEFCFDPVKNSLTAEIPVSDFNKKEFTAVLFYGSDREDLTFLSIVPENTMSLNQTLIALSKNQKSLIDGFYKDGVFSGKICARVIVKADTPYWYIGLTDENGKLTAFLMDGIDGSVKAVREVL